MKNNIWGEPNVTQNISIHPLSYISVKIFFFFLEEET